VPVALRRSALRGTVAVITGASSGIGRASALALADQGVHVVLAARREGPLQKAAAQCRAKGVQAVAVPTDVADERAVLHLADEALALRGRLDHWVNCAGVTLYGRTDTLPMVDLQRVLDVNVSGYVHGARAALRVFRQRGHGTLVNVGSVIGVTGQAYSAAYVMSKFAVNGLGWALRQELAADGVRGVHVCTVLPAMIDTPVLHHAGNHTGRALRPLPPVYPPEEVARAVVSAARRPRREVYAGGAGRLAVLGARVAPGIVERGVAYATDLVHLSHRRTAPVTSGALHTPVSAGTEPEGGWHGRARARARRLAAVGVITAGLTVAARRRASR